MMKISAVVSVYMILMQAPVFAQQQPQSDAHPAPDDPQVFAAFLRAYEADYAWLERSETRTASQRSREEGAFAARYGVAASDLTKILDVGRTVADGVAKINDDVGKHIKDKQAKNEKPDRDILLRFELQRQQLLASALERLKKDLGESGWNSLRTQMNEQFRPQIRMTPRPGGR